MTGSSQAPFRRVQAQTTAVAMATVAVVLVIGSIALVRVFEHQQLQQIDQRLHAASQVVEAATSGALGMPSSSAVTSGALVQVVGVAGDVSFATDRLAGRPAMRQVDEGEAGAPTTAHVEGVGPVRVIAIPLGERWLLFAESLQGVEDAVTGLRTVLVVGVPVLALLLAALLWVVIGRALRPARSAMDRERRLVADVSHELRTPLAGARALLESESQIPAEVELNRLEALAVLTRLESMANDLLVEARNGEVDANRLDVLVDLDDVVLDLVDVMPLRPGVEIDVSSVSAGQVRGTEADLARMVANLVANAIRHARTRVDVTLTEREGIVRLTVVDDGAGIAVEDRERAFERFTRLDAARNRDRSGAGLGLPIARSVAIAHGGTIEIGDADLGGAELVVTLPAAARSSPDPRGGSRRHGPRSRSGRVGGPRSDPVDGRSGRRRPEMTPRA